MESFKKEHIGNYFSSWLHDEGIYQEVKSMASNKLVKEKKIKEQPRLSLKAVNKIIKKPSKRNITDKPTFYCYKVSL